MIERTFVHLPGVGAVTEQRLWQRGFHSWDQLHEALSAGSPIRDLLRLGTPHRTTHGLSSEAAHRATTFPFPSDPYCPPTTMVLGISVFGGGRVRCRFSVANRNAHHVPFRNPASSVPGE